MSEGPKKEKKKIPCLGPNKFFFKKKVQCKIWDSMPCLGGHQIKVVRLDSMDQVGFILSLIEGNLSSLLHCMIVFL